MVPIPRSFPTAASGSLPAQPDTDRFLLAEIRAPSLTGSQCSCVRVLTCLNFGAGKEVWSGATRCPPWAEQQAGREAGLGGQREVGRWQSWAPGARAGDGWRRPSRVGWADNTGGGRSADTAFVGR